MGTDAVRCGVDDCGYAAAVLIHWAERKSNSFCVRHAIELMCVMREIPLRVTPLNNQGDEDDSDTRAS